MKEWLGNLVTLFMLLVISYAIIFWAVFLTADRKAVCNREFSDIYTLAFKPAIKLGCIVYGERKSD